MFFAITGFVHNAAARETPTTGPVRWERLPSIADPEGFASPFAGISGGALIVAGGANFPDKRPWEGGEKKWYDSAFVLELPHGTWKAADRLPRPTAYGVSIPDGNAIICIGGGDAHRHFRDVFRLTWDGRRLSTTPLPDLPRPCAFMCGAVVNRVAYVAGGIEEPGSTHCMASFWSMDLGRAELGWHELEKCPGPERMLAVAGATQGDDGGFYLFSGAKLTPGTDGKPVREYLKDAWRYSPGAPGGKSAGWKRLADLPRAAVAAPSPAPLLDDRRLLVISGDDGKHFTSKPEAQHPGFPRDVLAYDLAADQWEQTGDAPFSRATVPAIPWDGSVIIPNGESRPGYRTPEVWLARNP